MYTDNDLDSAVEQGIFSSESVAKFKQRHAQGQSPNAADEENFRLLVSFNDVFVVMAIGLLLLSLAWVTHPIHESVSAITVALASWLLAEFFVRKRKMALPAVTLLMTFVSALFASVLLAYDIPTEHAFTWAGLAATFGAWLHWKRFNVPITVAAGALALVVFVISLLVSWFPQLMTYFDYVMFASGIGVFLLAMYWDGQDVQRITRKSDVAFWLHLAAAPLIVHPVFFRLGLAGFAEATTLMAFVGLYFLLTLMSLVIDRRAFMVSSLLYVLVALTRLFETSGFAGDSFAYVGILMGFSLLLLSGFWHKARKPLVMHLPNAIQRRVPNPR